MKIQNIIIPLNDFLLEPDIVKAGLYIAKNGGVPLLTKSANKPTTYIMRKFFNYLYNIPSLHPYEREYYYEDVKIPPLILDHLLNKDTYYNILNKSKIYINKNAKWADRNGIVAIADMTFDDTISSSYRLLNRDILNIVKSLSNKYNIYVIDNCCQMTLHKVRKDLNFIEDKNITGSCEIGALKCAKNLNYDIYEHLVKKHHIDLSETLFIDTQEGYINSIKSYGKYSNTNIKTVIHNNSCNTKEHLIESLKNVNINVNDDINMESDTLVETINMINENISISDKNHVKFTSYIETCVNHEGNVISIDHISEGQNEIDFSFS